MANSTLTPTACQAVQQGPSRNRAILGALTTLSPLGAEAACGVVSGIATFTADDKVELTFSAEVLLDTDEQVQVTLHADSLAGTSLASWVITQSVGAATAHAPITVTYADVPGLVSGKVYVFGAQAA